MQISGSNLLIASQQMAASAAAPTPARPGFASALAKETPAQSVSFEPLDFKPAEAPRPAHLPAPAAAGPANGLALRPGSQLDIRV